MTAGGSTKCGGGQFGNRSLADPLMPSASGRSSVNPFIFCVAATHYKKSLVDRKAEFYQTDNAVTGNFWGANMRVERDEYLQKWGVGRLIRNE
jgi:hypothetical protein